MKYFALMLVPAMWLTACNRSAKTEENTKQPDTIQVDHTQAVTTPKTDTIGADRLIIPGKAIGQTALNDNGAEVVKRLGQPDAGDAAMGKALSIWYANHDSTAYQTMIYTTRQMGTEDDVARVKQIRVTSPWFSTGDGIHAGSTLQEIDAHHKANRTATFTKSGKTYTIYKADDGIAFEIDTEGTCKGIIIYGTDAEPGAMYLPFYDNLKIIKKR